MLANLPESNWATCASSFLPKNPGPNASLGRGVFTYFHFIGKAERDSFIGSLPEMPSIAMVEPCQNQESKTPSSLHSAVPQEAEADAEVGDSELSIWIGDIGASHNAHYSNTLPPFVKIFTCFPPEDLVLALTFRLMIHP